MNPDRKRLLIIGGSTRAAAWSATRAGFDPICADLFADADTRRIAEVVPVRDYPTSLPDDIAHVQAEGWLFTGALENYPDLLEKISHVAVGAKMLGCSPAAIQLVRDPFWIAATLQAAGFPVLPVQGESAPPISDGTWLQKPISGGGGRVIRVWNNEAQLRPFGERHYFQRRGTGEAMSGVFWRDSSRFHFIGATRQLINLDISGSEEPFAYCGSIGPIQFPDRIAKRLTEMGRVLAETSGLTGLFGIDFLQEGDEILLVELNPRYCASVEIIERAQKISIMNLYRDMFERANSCPENWNAASESHFSTSENFDPSSSNHEACQTFTKIVIFARERFVAPDVQKLLASDTDDSTWFSTEIAILDQAISPRSDHFSGGKSCRHGLADVPNPGAVIESGWPICTVICSGPSASQSMNAARSQVERLREYLRNSNENNCVLDRRSKPR